MSGPPNGEERRGGERRDDFLVDIVTRAAHQAAQDVAAIHRKRLVRQCFLAALAAALLICIPIVLITSHSRSVASAKNARFNCSQWHEGATVLRLFLQSDAKLRRDQQNYSEKADVITGFEKIIDSNVLKRLIARSARLDRNAQDYWLNNLVPRLDELANVNCAAVITTSGPQNIPSPSAAASKDR